MAQQQETWVAQLKRPSDRAIAFAVAIVSSKPEELTVKEYIALLRQHVAKGRRENALSAAYRHLDRTAYWRTECERLKDSLRASEAATVDALRETEHLKTKLESAKANASPAKRKRADPDVVLVPRSPKKARRDVSPPRRGGLSDLELDTALEIEGAVEGAQDLMRALCMINTYLKPGIGVEREAASIAYHISKAAITVADATAEAMKQHLLPATEDDDALRVTLTAAGRVIAAVMLGFTRLVRAENATSLQGQVIHALAKMLEQLLDVMETIAAAETASSTTQETAQPSTASPTKKPKAFRNRVNVQDHQLLGMYTAFIAGILKHLDAKHDSHKSLYEAFAFIIISRLGKNLHTLSFHHERAADLEIGISTLEHDLDNPVPPPDTQAIQRAKLIAPFLLHLLKHVLSLAPAFLSTACTAASSKSSSKAKPTPRPGNITKTNLAVLAKERLQRTLVNAVFGTEGLDEEDDMLLEALRMPVLDGRVPAPKSVKEAEVGEWFRGEVWRLLGWEVLGREVEN